MEKIVRFLNQYGEVFHVNMSTLMLILVLGWGLCRSRFGKSKV